MKIFQTSSLFETNKFHHGEPPFSGGAGAIAPVAPPLIRPWVLQKTCKAGRKRWVGLIFHKLLITENTVDVLVHLLHL